MTRAALAVIAPPAERERGGDTARLESIHVMRGLAAVSVMLGHLTYANDHFRERMPEFSALFQHGHLGVWIFFVISGFVIPYAMHGGNYRWEKDAGRFLLRRLVRLEPPYVVSVFLALGIGYAASMAPIYRGQPFQADLETVLLQFVYLAPWFGKEWINGVAWTLAIEFQYYLLMLLVAPFLLSPSAFRRWGFLALIACLSLLSQDKRAVFLYLPCFAIGFIAFLRFHNRLGNAALVALAAGFAVLTTVNVGPLPAIASVVALPLIFVPVRRPVAVLSFLGTISYSLYLLHPMIGDRIINLTTRLPPVGWLQFAGLVLACGASLLAAFILWRFVERPSIGLARRWARSG